MPWKQFFLVSVCLQKCLNNAIDYIILSLHTYDVYSECNKAYLYYTHF
jgi:hypothetical protein